MKINNLEINDFRGLSMLDLHPEKINVFCGMNGSGKSSTLEAIRWALTGKAPENCVKIGAKNASVKFSLLGYDIERTAGAKSAVRVNGKAATQKVVQKLIEDATGITNDSIKVATSAGMLASMQGGSLSDYLLTNGLIAANADFAMMRTFGLSPEVENELAKYLPITGKFDMETIEAAYRECYDMRPVIKKQLAEKTAVASYDGAAPTRTVEEIDKAMQRFLAYDAELAAFKRLDAAYNDALARRQRVLDQIANLENQLKTKPEAKPVDAAELEFLVKTERTTTEAIAEMTRTKRVFDANIEMYNRTLANLDKPVCPISAKLICTTDKTEIKADLEELVQQNQEESDKVRAQIVATEQNLTLIREKLAKKNEQKKAYAESEALMIKIQALRSAVPVPPAKPVEPASSGNDPAERAALQDERKNAVLYAAAKEAQKDVEALTAQLEIYNALCDFLSPKGGVRERIVEIALEPLIDHCNDQAAKLKSDFTIGVKVDNGVNILCSPHPGVADPIPLDELSSGEQVFALMLVMDALNALTGLGILILDDLDKLDEEAFKALLTMLHTPGVIDDYDHVFMACVNHEDAVRAISAYTDMNVIFM